MKNKTVKAIIILLAILLIVIGIVIIVKKEEIIQIVDKIRTQIQAETEGSKVELSYDVLEREDNKVNTLVHIKDKENIVSKIEFPDQHIITVAGKKKEQIAIDYKVELGKEYKIKIILENGEIQEETILITDYWHKITKDLGEGIEIDNTAEKAAYNKPYQATLTIGDEYILDTLTVTMGGQEVTVDKSTAQINIERVTGDIEIKATSMKLEIETTTPIINTSSSATTSVADNSQTRGTTLYINFEATLEGTNCTIEPAVPYEIKYNEKYKFTATGTYNGITITKEIEIAVNKYKAVQGLVQYDAGDWTKEEIEELQSKKLYDINISKTTNKTYKLNSDSGLNFTFGGFTYKGDTTNESAIRAGTIITSRNQSVSPQSGYGTPLYDGWQILKTEEKDGKIYVTKLIHAGSPENFAFYDPGNSSWNGYRAEYLLSSGNRETRFSKLTNGTSINPRNWDMYKDKELDEKGYIDSVYMIQCTEAFNMKYPGDSIYGKLLDGTGAYYFCANGIGRAVAGGGHESTPYIAKSDGYYMSNWPVNGCFGVRPVIALTSGVYIASGSGTGADPYVLGKD